jgi:prevent-host-death family protein
MTTEPTERSQTLSVAEAKRRFSEVLGRVAHANERITITRREKPIAIIVPAAQREGLGRAKGWLSDRDAFFAQLDQSRQLVRSTFPEC